MLGIALRIIAALCFLLAAVNQTLLHQGPQDLVAWGLLAWVLSSLIGGGITFHRTAA